MSAITEKYLENFKKSWPIVALINLAWDHVWALLSQYNHPAIVFFGGGFLLALLLPAIIDVWYGSLAYLSEKNILNTGKLLEGGLASNGQLNYTFLITFFVGFFFVLSFAFFVTELAHLLFQMLNISNDFLTPFFVISLSAISTVFGGLYLVFLKK